MSNIVKEDKFIKSDVKNNNNKYWYIKLMEDFTVITENGRVGSKPQVHPKSFGNMEDAEKFYDKKVKEKSSPKKGYTKLKVLSGGTSTESVSSSNLLDIALKQIETSSPETAKLIKHLSNKNIHNILSATTMEYDESKGTFTTPCGIVTDDGIMEARELLGKISVFVNKRDFTSNEFIELLQQYIQLIPRKVGRKLVSDEVIPDIEAVEKESQLLDALSASLQQVLDDDSSDSETKEDTPKLFSLKLDVVNDDKVLSHIKKFYNKTRNRMHTSYNLKIKKVYSVEIEDMHKAFEEKGRPIGNIMELWHGTRVENVLSILKGGLIIPKSSAGHVTGRMFSDGLYFSDQSTKSLNYSQGYWGHGSKDNNCFMFIADVAMGKYYIPNGPSQNLPKRGYDSTFAKANVSGVRNNEMIVYNLYQANLKYLVEFDSWNINIRN